MKIRGRADAIHNLCEDKLKANFYLLVHDFPGGAPALAKAIDVSAGVLSNKADPFMDGHKPNLYETRAAMLAAKDFRVLDALAEDCGFAIVPLGKIHSASGPELLEQYTEVSATNGVFAQVFHKAVSDKKLTRKEVGQIRRIVRQEIGELEAFIATLEASAK